MARGWYGLILAIIINGWRPVKATRRKRHAPPAAVLDRASDERSGLWSQRNEILKKCKEFFQNTSAGSTGKKIQIFLRSLKKV